MLDELRGAIRSGDPQRAQRASHRLKGSVSIFAAKPLIERVEQLEDLGREDEMEKALPLLDEVEAGVEEALAGLRGLGEDGSLDDSSPGLVETVE